MPGPDVVPVRAGRRGGEDRGLGRGRRRGAPAATPHPRVPGVVPRRAQARLPGRQGQRTLPRRLPAGTPRSRETISYLAPIGCTLPVQSHHILLLFVFVCFSCHRLFVSLCVH